MTVTHCAEKQLLVLSYYGPYILSTKRLSSNAFFVGMTVIGWQRVSQNFIF